MNFDLNRDGYGWVHQAMDPGAVRQLLMELGPSVGAGRRGLLSVPQVEALARSKAWLDWVRPHLPLPPVPVRAIYIDKHADANWLVTWHQDLTLAVRERVEVPGFGPWSLKGGVPHVQPPIPLLEQMLTVRLHLVAAAETNGALCVLPGTHRLGRLSPERIQALRTEQSEVVCRAAAGDVLLLRPLLLHASGRSHVGGRRRILHVEYAGFALPAGLQWAETAGEG